MGLCSQNYARLAQLMQVAQGGCGSYPDEADGISCLLFPPPPFWRGLGGAIHISEDHQEKLQRTLTVCQEPPLFCFPEAVHLYLRIKRHWWLNLITTNMLRINREEDEHDVDFG